MRGRQNQASPSGRCGRTARLPAVGRPSPVQRRLQRSWGRTRCWYWHLTGSAVLAGLVGTSSAVAGFVLRLPAGAWADRFDRRLVLIGCDIVRTLAVGALTVLVLLHDVRWPWVLVAAVVDEVGGVLFSPASTAALPAVVPVAQLEEARAAGEANMCTALVLLGQPWEASCTAWEGLSRATGGSLIGDHRAELAQPEVPWLVASLGGRLGRKGPPSCYLTVAGWPTWPVCSSTRTCAAADTTRLRSPRPP